MALADVAGVICATDPSRAERLAAEAEEICRAAGQDWGDELLGDLTEVIGQTASLPSNDSDAADLPAELDHAERVARSESTPAEQVRSLFALALQLPSTADDLYEHAVRCISPN